MVVHGGGWLIVGKAAMATGEAAWFNRHGYTAYDVDYRVGRDSLVDVVAAYDYLRRRFGPRAEICADGQSVGGQLAQLLAASRPSLDCLISEAGIEDLRSATTQCGYLGRNCGWMAAAEHLVWGDDLWEFSPVRLARDIQQPFLAAGSRWDTLVDESAQLDEIKRVRPQTETMLLAGAAVPAGWAENFVHASGTPAALQQFHRAVQRLLARAAPRVVLHSILMCDTRARTRILPVQHQHLRVRDDEWFATLDGENHSNRVLEIKLNGGNVARMSLMSPLPLQISRPRQGVSVRWEVKREQATVTVAYDGQGTAASIRAVPGFLDKWKLSAAARVASVN